MALGARKYVGNHTPAHRIVIWLSIGVIALIAYGSLYPFDLKPQAGRSLWQALLQLSWARAGRGDRISNVLLYVPLGFCVFLSLDGRMRRVAAAVSAIATGAMLSFAIEVAQVFISSRVPSLWDVTFNVCGAVGGAVGGVAWRILSARLLATDSSARRDGVAAVGVALWLAWRWAPFELQVNLGTFKAALQPLIHPAFGVAQCAHYLLWWTIAAQMLFAIVNRTRGTENLLALIAITLAGRLFFVDSPLGASELAALLLLLPLLVGLHKLQAGVRHASILIAFVAAYLIDTLSPWNFSGDLSRAGARFDFWPFINWIEAGMPIDATWLLRRLFQFVAAAWLLRKVGCGARVTVYLVTGAALAVECLQAWLPNRSGSLTEPVLALAVTLTLRLLAERAGGATLQRARSR